MTYEQALSRLTALCSKAEYCTHDIEGKALRWGLPEAMRKKLLAYLKEEKYIDDARFARVYAKEKMRFNRWGRQKIYMSLRQKGVDKDIINAALGEVEEDDYVAILKPLLRQKAPTIKAKNAYERNAKLFRFAQSRGFTAEIIRQCMPDGTDEQDE